MAIETNPFGGVRLSGEDAVRFLEYARMGSPSVRAMDSAARGVAMAAELLKHGSVQIVPSLAQDPL